MKQDRSPTSEDLEAVAELRSRREQIGLSQADLAAIAGVSQQQWAKYERGEDRISIGRYRKIDGYLNQAEHGRAPGFGERSQPPYGKGSGPDAPSEVAAILTQLRAAVAALQEFLRLVEGRDLDLSDLPARARSKRANGRKPHQG